MHNRVLIVALSIVAFIATAGLVIAASPTRYGNVANESNATGAPSASSDSSTLAEAGARRSAPKNPWLGVDPTMEKPAMRLKPRIAKIKPGSVERAKTTNGSRLVVKFNDDVKLRTLPNGRLISLTGKDISSLEEVTERNAVILESMSQLPQERMDSIINRAEANSGRAQPDIAGMYYVYGFERDVDDAAKDFLAHPDVEFAYFQGMDGYTASSSRIAAASQPKQIAANAKPAFIAGGAGAVLTAAPYAHTLQVQAKPSLKPQISVREDPTNLFPRSSKNTSATAQRYLAGKTGGERGACCTVDGCENLTLEDCKSIGGAYRGAFTHCDSGICTETRAVFGACCFLDEIVAPVPLHDALVANGVAIGIGDDSTGPGNPFVVKNCQIVQDVGDPADENYIPASEVCGEAQGTYFGNGNDCSNDLCGNFGGCCVDGDCENQLQIDCEGLDIHSVFADSIGPAAGNYWPTMPEGTLPGHGQFNRGYAVDVVYDILLWTGTPPDTTDVAGPAGECALDDGAGTNFDFLTYNENCQAIEQANWSAFDGLRGAWDGYAVAIQENGEMIATSKTAGAGDVEEATYRLSYHPDAELLDVGFGDFSYCAEFAWDNNNGCAGNFNAVPPAVIGPCQNFVSYWQCRMGNPFFCNIGPAVDTGVVPWWTGEEELGLTCEDDAEDVAPFIADCGNVGDPEDEMAALLHGDCYWDRDFFPTYFNSYEVSPFGPPTTPWNASAMCYNGPMCNNINCCDAVCSVDPNCCVPTVGVAAWNEDCSNIATSIALGVIEPDEGFCSLGSYVGRWFPELPTTPGPALGPGLAPAPWAPTCGQVMALTSNGCFSGTEDTRRAGGCSDLNCCNVVIQNAGAPWDAACGADWGFIDPTSGLSCSDQARILCYPNAASLTTPDYTPLQFHLQGSSAGNTRALQALANTMPQGVGLLPTPWALHLDDPTDDSNGNGLGDDPIDDAFPTDFWPWQSINGVDFAPLGTGQQNQLPRRWSGSGLGLDSDPTNPLSPSQGLYSWGAWLAQISEGNHPAGPNVNGTKGLGVKIAVLDLAAWVQEYNVPGLGRQGAIHEDLTHIKLEGRDTPHAPIRMLFDEEVTRPQRGTGILGLISAAENGFGVTGVAPEADTYFFPLVDADLGFREVNAWLNAIDTLQYGDILLATYLHDYGHTQCVDSCLINDESAQVLMGLASATGIKIVTPAGDWGCDIGATFDAGLEETSDVTIVAGCMPNRFAQRWWSSNYDTLLVSDSPGGGVDDPDDGETDEVNTAITCSFWGGPYVTTGGDMGLTETFRTNLPFNTPDPTDLSIRSHTTAQMRAGYTNNFGNNTTDGGSTAASAVVAGVLACSQGFSLQRYGVKQSPSMLKKLVWDQGEPKTNPDGDNYNSQLLADAGTIPTYSYDFQQVDGAPWNPQRTIQPDDMGTAIVTDGDYALDDGGLITDFNYVKGTLQGGTLASLREIDEVHVVGTSSMVFGSGYHNPSGFYCPGPVYYSHPGHYHDKLVEYTIPSSQPIGNAISTVIKMDRPAIEVDVELFTWNWVKGMWEWSSEGTVTVAPDDDGELELLTFTTFVPNYHEVVNSSGKMYQRVKIEAYGIENGPGAQIRVDHINLNFRPGGYDDGPNGTG